MQHLLGFITHYLGKKSELEIPGTEARQRGQRSTVEIANVTCGFLPTQEWVESSSAQEGKSPKKSWALNRCFPKYVEYLVRCNKK